MLALNLVRRIGDVPVHLLRIGYLIPFDLPVVLDRRLALLDAVGREESVLNALTERIGVDWFAEILVGVAVGVAFRRGRQPHVRRACEILQDRMPFALVVRPAAVTLVDNDEVEEVPRELLELHLRLLGLARSHILALALLAQQRLVKREIDDAVQRRIVHRRLEPIAIPLCKGEAVERLIRKDVAVGQEEDARLVQPHPLPRPFCRDELMAELICDEGLARSGRERDERILLPRAERLDDTLDRPLLIVADAAVACE